MKVTDEMVSAALDAFYGDKFLPQEKIDPPFLARRAMRITLEVAMLAAEKPENPRAFPLVVGSPDDQWGALHEGMTLRDYFAGQASGALISSIRTNDLTIKCPELVAGWAYKYADALLKEREKNS